jgi:hypothetical protein
MIYLDSSAALAYLLAEDRNPSHAVWQQQVVSSRLLEVRSLEPDQRASASGLAR